ncbi:MAG: hypothetical protein U0527_13285 [Candidatus Eisenbacteria bacterium]
MIRNSAPVIERVFTQPVRVHAEERVSVVVVARDRDNDRLRFAWSATRGTFPEGNVLAATSWQTASSRGLDTVRVRVSDAADSAIGILPVELVLPAPPARLTLVNASSLLEVHWDKSLDHGIEHWSGYEVYVADRSLLGLSNAEISPYLATPTPLSGDNLAFRVQRLPDGRPLRSGTKYYVHLRAIREYGGIVERGEPSIELDMSPRPEWVLAQFTERRHEFGAIALDLSAGRARVLDPNNATGRADRDLFLDGGPSGLGPLELNSVSLLAEFDPAWAERPVLLKRLGTDWAVGTTSDDGWALTVAVRAGDVYAIKLPEGNYAKLRVTDVVGSAPNRQAQVVWAYQTIPGYPSF